MHNNAASRRPSVYAVARDQDDFGTSFMCSKGERDRGAESVYRLCLDRRRLRGSPSLVGRWIAKDERPSARIQCALRPGVQIPLPARMLAERTLSAPDENHGERFKKGARG